MSNAKLDFSKLNGLIPVVVQDAASKRVLMLGFMNEEALEKTESEGRVTFYSRSKKRLWTKGETSGNFLKVVQISKDCDQDSLLIMATPSGPVCHTGAKTCFSADGDEHASIGFLTQLEILIKKRKQDPKADSYTSSLFDKGLNRIAQKVGEEAVEVVIASKDTDKEKLKEEAADLLYHYLVLLVEKELCLADVIAVLKQRNK